jgi:hypothetical protein
VHWRQRCTITRPETMFFSEAWSVVVLQGSGPDLVSK